MTKQRRMSQIFAKDGKSITLALDGFYFSTNTDGIDRTIENLPALIENGLDAALVTYGMAKTSAEKFADIAMLVRCDYSTNLFDASVPDTGSLIRVEDAIKVGADGIISMTFPGAANEASSHKIAWELARDADLWNLPYMCETLPFGYPVTTPESNQANIIGKGARIGEELGADIIKTRFSGEADDVEIVKATNLPVVALGGPKTESILDYFKFVRHVMDCGAKGVAVGRNITQNENPVGVVAGLNVIIHEDGTAEQAYEAFQSKTSSN